MYIFLVISLWFSTIQADKPQSLKIDSSCNCQFTIPTDQYKIDGYLLEAKPGDTICIQAGRRPFLHIYNFKGSAEKNIVFKNCQGQVVLGGPEVSNGILVMNSENIRITGSGSTDKYGFLIKGTREGGMGVQITKFSSGVEVDHIEVASAGFAGIMAKTDPLCDGSADRGKFTMYNMSFHDNYIHDVGGEGIYLGNSFYTGTDVYCNEWHLPHEVKGVKIFNNVLNNTGWDAIQVGCAVEDCDIFNNSISNYATMDKPMQRSAILVSKGTTGKVYRNYINKGSGAGIEVQGIGDNYIFNNTVISPGREAFEVNVKNPMPEKGVYIINNTVINAPVVLREHVNKAANNVFFNNLIINSALKWKVLSNYTDWTIDSNLFVELASLKYFDKSELNNQILKKESNALRKGKNVADYFKNCNFEDMIFSSEGSYDIGAY